MVAERFALQAITRAYRREPPFPLDDLPSKDNTGPASTGLSTATSSVAGVREYQDWNEDDVHRWGTMRCWARGAM
jgi:hypothetical protein